MPSSFSGELFPPLLFAGIHADERQRIAPLCRLANLEPEQAIVCEGELSRDVYVLLHGQARVEKRDHAGNQRLLTVLEATAMFGELGMLTGEPRSATVTTIGLATVVSVDGEKLLELIAADDVAALRMSHNILRNLARRQVSMNRNSLLLLEHYDRIRVEQERVTATAANAASWLDYYEQLHQEQEVNIAKLADDTAF